MWNGKSPFKKHASGTFFIAIQRRGQCGISLAVLILSTHLHCTYLTSSLILTSNLNLDLQSALSQFSDLNVVCIPYILIRATFSAHLMLYLSYIIFCEPTVLDKVLISL
jgi:hypothetical protein